MSDLTDRPDLFVDGRWVAPRSGRRTAVREASTGLAFGLLGLAGPEDVDEAVRAARRAIEGPWSALSRAERAAMVRAFAAALRAAGKETSALVSRENGMPIRLSRIVNGLAPSAIAGYYGDLAAAEEEVDLRPSPTGGRTLVQRRPVGVVAAITPWNYPQALAVMKLAPALAAGCTVVLKPPPETGLDAFAFADAAIAAGLPAGVVNVVPGGREEGARLVAHPGVDKVAFTGSTGAGRAIGEMAGRLLRPATLELGGKSVSLIAEDADLDLVAARLAEISLPNNGQTCHAATRILAPRSRYAEVVEAVSETVAALSVGDPLDPATEIGPLVSEDQQRRVESYAELAATEGRVTVGGERHVGAGWFVRPTVVVDVQRDARIAQEEVFGPVLAVLPYEDEDDAISIANDSEFGLGGVVWSQDEERGLRLAGRIDTGTVGVNHYELHINAPFGGVKASGLGRELGPEGLDPYLVTRSVYLR
ncbi:aldehyde dehydrogenase [Nocardioides sp. TRM66260-LWL]|uniref:aldehyde dehydrogenase n=1 Tax=Nocardioides sp. TRM66260-LWL TaxID=2874478 RepID=UPI001CC69D86|nr:aldehyde dehydrogenase [Nocardioides sp. TRM66260-LWL]MBZ5735299.1 aldehyde dehydrogenase [Nocardioides sp. TRM66260-LWL]